MAGIHAGLALVLLSAQWTTPAAAQTQVQLDNAVRFGGIAAIEPLCALRDPGWAADLRRAELRAMGVPLHPSPPHSPQQVLADRAGAALSFAEDEALEAFAGAPPGAACRKLAQDPDLTRADGMVAALRAGTDLPIW